MVNNRTEISEAGARQLFVFLNTVSAVNRMVTDGNTSELAGAMDKLAKSYGVNLKDELEADEKRENMKLCAKEFLVQAQAIREKNGKVEIVNESLYRDIIYMARYKHLHAEALHEVLELSKKIPLSKIIPEINVGEKITDVIRDTVNFIGNGYAADIAERIIKNNEIERLTVMDLIDHTVQMAEDYIEKEKEQIEIQNSYKFDQQTEYGKELLDSNVAKAGLELGIDKDGIYNVKDHVLRETIDHAKTLLTKETIAIMKGFDDIDSEIRPLAPKYGKEDISDELRNAVKKSGSTWCVSMVNAGKTIAGEVLVSRRLNLLDRLKMLREREIKEDLSTKERARIKKMANDILTKDAALKEVFKRKYKGIYGMHDIAMDVLDNRRAELESQKSKDARQRGLEFAFAISQSNLFRCGISQNIPGWMTTLHVGPEEKAWAMAFLKAGQHVTTDGVEWNSYLVATKAEAEYNRYMKHVRYGAENFEKNLSALEKAFVQEHSRLVKELVANREKQGLLPLDYQVHFNPAFNNPERQEPFHWESVNVSRYLNKDYSQEKAFNERQMDAVLVIRNNTVSLIAKGEYSSISAYIGEEGHAKKMHVDGEKVFLTDDMKHDNVAVFQKGWNVVTENVVLESYPDEKDQGKIGRLLRECLPFGYRVDMSDGELKILDPDEKHEFSYNRFDPAPDGKSQTIDHYCNRLRNEFIEELEQKAGGKKIIAAVEKDLEKRYKDRMYAFVKDPYMEKAVMLQDIFRKCLHIQREDLLDPNKREDYFLKFRLEFNQGGYSEMHKEQERFHERMSEIKKLHKSDPLLAWTNLILPESERVGDGIKVVYNEKEYVLNNKMSIDLNDSELVEVLSKYQAAMNECKKESSNPAMFINDQHEKEQEFTAIDRGRRVEEHER